MIGSVSVNEECSLALKMGTFFFVHDLVTGFDLQSGCGSDCRCLFGGWGGCDWVDGRRNETR